MNNRIWNSIADFILSFRLYIIIVLAAITLMMGWMARKAELSYDLMKIVPADDPDMLYLNHFNEMFGEDANVFAIGMRDSAVYRIENFRALAQYSEAVAKVDGIEEVLSLPRLLYLKKDTDAKRFIPTKLFDPMPETQADLDSLLQVARDIRLYENRLYNAENGATLLLITMKDRYLNSKKRLDVIADIQKASDVFEAQTGIDLHFAGLPYVRGVIQTKVKQELNMFLLISLGVTAVVFFFFFRAFSPVFFSLLVIGMVVIWTMGTTAILGYKITMLTGLLPPILVVIGVPNCIYLLNKYHQEFIHHRDKVVALGNVIRKIGIVTLITNTTTAIGFAVLLFTGIGVMQEFGIVATINIFNTFIISLLFIPAVFSYRPEPTSRHMQHLDFKFTNGFLRFLDDVVVHKHRRTVYAIAVFFVVIATYGTWQIRALAFMVDDLPEDSTVKKDLAFFEQNFGGIMPLEIVVDTGDKRGVRNRKHLVKVNQLEEYLASVPEIAPPISVVTVLKAANQAFFNNNPADYQLPSNRDQAFLQPYLKSQGGQQDMIRSFVDSSGQILRISMKVADLGSIKMDSLIQGRIQPAIDSIFRDSGMQVRITGTTLLFIKGNKYLINNLLSSMVLAFVLIAAIMGALFRNFRIILISLIPNMIPLLMTAGLMGFLNVPLKPSTALVFSITFGIAVDDAIHFLAKYRQELLIHHFDISKAISVSIRETGSSMLYTSIVLFFGFVIFTASDFGGTIALGALTSTTLLIAMFTNLILLPCLLMSFDITGEKLRFQAVFEKLEHDYFYDEHEDEDIDIRLIERKQQSDQ